jgi:hypothetical protein
MPRKRHKAEEIVAELRQVEVLTAQGTPDCQNHTRLRGPLPAGATLYARGWTGDETEPEPGRRLTPKKTRKTGARCFEPYMAFKYVQDFTRHFERPANEV